MNYRILGKTGLKVSEIGFGTIPILSGNVPVLPDYFNLDLETAIDVMTYAYKLGCNLYDTAIVPEYGDAEIKTGIFSIRIGRENIILSDKARFFTGEGMYDAVQCSYQNLGTYADIYFVHQADEKNADEIFKPYGAIHALMECKAEGKIRFIGVASHYYSVLYRAACDDRVDVLQGSGNILERGMLDRIEKEPCFLEKGFLLNKVYAAGILPSFFSVQELLGAALSYPISSALIGLGTKEQIKLAILGNRNQYNRGSFLEVMARLEQYFQPIPCDRCQKCHCPYGVELSILFRQYNYYFLGKDNWALRKLAMNIEECAMLCKTCTKLSCIQQCPRKLRIPELVQKIDNMVRIYIKAKKD